MTDYKHERKSGSYRCKICGGRTHTKPSKRKRHEDTLTHKKAVALLPTPAEAEGGECIDPRWLKVKVEDRESGKAGTRESQKGRHKGYRGYDTKNSI